MKYTALMRITVANPNDSPEFAGDNDAAKPRSVSQMLRDWCLFIFGCFTGLWLSLVSALFAMLTLDRIGRSIIADALSSVLMIGCPILVVIAAVIYDRRTHHRLSPRLGYLTTGILVGSSGAITFVLLGGWGGMFG